MKNLITAAIIAMAATSAHADTNSFEYAENIAKQAPAVEACIADTLESLTPYYGGEMLGGQTTGEKQAEMWMNGTTYFTDKERLERFSHSGLYDRVMSGNITAAQATQAKAEILACVTY